MLTIKEISDYLNDIPMLIKKGYYDAAISHLEYIKECIKLMDILKNKDKIIEDAIELGYLIECCAGCGSPYSQKDAEAEGKTYKDCGCPCGTSYRWNKKLTMTTEKTNE